MATISVSCSTIGSKSLAITTLVHKIVHTELPNRLDATVDEPQPTLPAATDTEVGQASVGDAGAGGAVAVGKARLSSNQMGVELRFRWRGFCPRQKQGR